MKAEFLLSLGIILLSVIPFSQATDYYVSPTGSTSWSQCTNISTPCLLATANQNAQAGDTVYIRGGTYYFPVNSGIKPTNSGSANKFITFSAYSNETVNFIGNGNDPSNMGNCVDLSSGQHHIKVHGIICTKFWHHLYMKGGSFNEISYCQFLGIPGVRGQDDFDNAGSIVQYGSHHNWIHDCTFADWGAPCYPCPNTPYERGTNLLIGWDVGYDGDDYNILENCTLYHGGHDAFGVHGVKNIIRGNKVHNEQWMSYQGGMWGQRDTFTIGGVDNQHNLWEKNKFGYAGYPQTVGNCEGSCVTMQGNKNVYRYNVMYQCVGGGFEINVKSAVGHTNGNAVYGNTLWYNGYDSYSPVNKTGCWYQSYSHASVIEQDSNCVNNIMVNNLFYQNNNSADATVDMPSIFPPYHEVTGQTIRNNWKGAVNGDPKFVNISGTPDPMQTDQFDFNLQSSSKAIDGGTYLATATRYDANTLTLSDPSGNPYISTVFSDGYGIGSAWAAAGKNVNVQADQVCFTTSSTTVDYNNCRAIESINYTNNRITITNHGLAGGTTYYVWLYKISDGTGVLYDSAPDTGAYEYQSVLQNCSQLSGSCCSSVQNCSGSFQPSSDCANCCTGGICQSCLHKSDINCDGKVCMTELSAFINRWYINNQDVTMKEIIEAIGLWQGSGC